MKENANIYIETFGCQMNILDTELAQDDLSQRGYSFVEDPKKADVVLYNTCSVRDLSEQKVLSRLGIQSQRKKSGSDVIVGVLGCMAERKGEALQKEFPVDILIGPSELDRLGDLIEAQLSARSSTQKTTPESALSNFKNRKLKVDPARPAELDAFDRGRIIDESKTGAQAYVRITRGCNKFCAFCVVPYTRGEEVHRHPSDIVSEVQKLTDAGAKEVTLLGQTINHYRYEDTGFAELLRRVHDECPELPRLRYLTSYPRDFTEDMLDAMAECERVAPFLHIPAQSGSNRILKKMNRGYTRESYLELVRMAREKMPNLTIVGDMIVGFPSETDAEFEESLTLLQEVQYKTVYVFKYSPRPGTVSGKRDEDDIPIAVKKSRNNRMLDLQKGITLVQHQALVGQTHKLLVESVAKNQGLEPNPTSNLVTIGSKNTERRDTLLQLTGRTVGDHIVHFKGERSLIGQIVNVRVEEARGLSCSGTRI